MTDNAHDRRTLEERLQWIADWSEPGIDLADAGTAREALDRIKSQAIRIRQLEAERQRLITDNNVLTNERDALKAEVARFDDREPASTAVADSAAADSVVNGGAREITQADRDAAASVAVLVEMRELIRAGRADHHAEPFARHREAALDTAAPLIRAQIADNLDAMRRDETNWPQVIARLIREGKV